MYAGLPVPAGEVRPGDRALHVDGHDGRTVVRVTRSSVWLDILGTSVGPCPKRNYVFIRRIEGLSAPE